jgi:hypothetical protein
MTTATLPDYKKELHRPLAGTVFVVFWIVSLALWITAPFMTNPKTGGFLIDAGLILASVGFSGLFLATKKAFFIALVAGAIGIIAAAIFGFTGVTSIVYFIRLITPFLALLAPLFRFANNFKVF